MEKWEQHSILIMYSALASVVYAKFFDIALKYPPPINYVIGFSSLVVIFLSILLPGKFLFRK